jgi:SPP1 family predicted phage head-tail adaptor
MNNSPPIGRLRHRLKLQSPYEITDDAGGMLRTYIDVTTLYAAITARTGQERWIAARVEQVLSHRIDIRFRADVSAGHRFILTQGGQTRTFDIHAAYDPDGRRTRLVCLAEEIRA